MVETNGEGWNLLRKLLLWQRHWKVLGINNTDIPRVPKIQTWWPHFTCLSTAKSFIPFSFFVSCLELYWLEWKCLNRDNSLIFSLQSFFLLQSITSILSLLTQTNCIHLKVLVLYRFMYFNGNNHFFLHNYRCSNFWNLGYFTVMLLFYAKTLLL